MKPFDPTGPIPPGVSLIEASAGTGKTYTMTSLFLRLILERELSLDQILVVTFTEAATAELRDRVRRRLYHTFRVFRGEDTDDELLIFLRDQARERRTLITDQDRLWAALTSFDEAAISTIHGFCHRVLRENAFESGVPFDAELIADEEPLRDEVVRDFWINELHRASPAYLRFLASLTDSREVSLARLRALARKVCSPQPLHVVPEEAGEIPPGPGDEQLDAAIDRVAGLWRDHRDEALALLQSDDLYKDYLKKLDKCAHELDRWVEGTPNVDAGVPGCIEHFSSHTIDKKTKKKATPPEHPLFTACDELLSLARQRTDHLTPKALELLLRFVRTVPEDLRRRKRAGRVQSFDDLLYNLAQALRSPTGPVLARALTGRFRAALIDEFQDTDPVQYDIFRRLFVDRIGGGEAGWLLLIGDPKQAIYSFRGADIYAYLAAADSAGDRCFTLETNYRSDARLVDAFNQLYERSPAPFVEAGIDYSAVRAKHEEDRLIFPGGPRPPLRFRFAHVDDFPDGLDGTSARLKSGATRLKKAWGNQNLPLHVAAEVADLLEGGAELRPEGQEPRPLQPGDIAVLVRKNAQALTAQEALRQWGIPSVHHGSESVFRTAEARDLRSILAAVAEPVQARRVRAALASDTLGYTSRDLARLEEEERAWEDQIEWFRGLHQLWADLGFMRMYRSLLEESDLVPRLLGLVDGERRLTNLRHLGELLHRAETESRFGITGLIRWLDRQRTEGIADAEAAQIRLESDGRAVQLVTMHKAKGLQYPVVICPYLWDGSVLHPADKKQLLFHDPDHDQRLTLDLGSDGQAAHKARAEYEARAEMQRLAYVAMTRAEHLCVVYTGAFAGIETSALGYLLYPQAPETGGGEPGLEASTREIKGMKSAQMLETLTNIASRSQGSIEATVLGPPPEPQLRATDEERAELSARVLGRRFDRRWRTASFTQLTKRGVSLVSPAARGRDRDEELETDETIAAEPLSLAPELGEEKVPLADFARGAEAGTFLHSVYELCDFGYADLSELREVVVDRLVYYGLDAETWADRVTAALDQCLRTPLERGDRPLRLRDVPPTDRLNELEFIFPVARPTERALVAEHLADLLRRFRGPNMAPSYPDQVAALGFEPLEGYLKGFIDLVFRHDDRWYVVDYKSNHLGDVRGAYTPDRLREAMAHHNYYLQYLLYTVALHRYLTWRLPGYDFDQHFGGVYYLFLRGMSPGTGPAFGVFHDEPSRDLVLGLSELLDRAEGGAS